MAMRAILSRFNHLRNKIIEFNPKMAESGSYELIRNLTQQQHLEEDFDGLIDLVVALVLDQTME